MDTARILICEDEQLTALDIKTRLEQFGHVVTGIAASGRQAIDLARDTKPDLALMDVHLSDMLAGTDVAQILMREFAIPSIFLTAYSDDETLDEAKQSMPLGFLVKPVNDNDLRSAIEIGTSLFNRHKCMEKEAQARLSKLQMALIEVGQNPSGVEDRNDMVKSERERVLSNISAGVAHHLNNALAGIAGSLQWLEKCGTIAPFETRFIRGALQNCNNAAVLVNDLLWSSGQGLFMLEFCHLKEKVEEAIELVRKNAGEKCHIVTRFPTQTLSVVAHGKALCHAMEAIITNACEATGDAGEVVVSVYREYFENPVHNNSDAKPGWYGVIKVRDMGPGMEPEVLDHATEPFFSAASDFLIRPGMGLSVAQGVAQSLGGWLAIESEEHVGTTVKLCIPLCEHRIAQKTETEETEAEASVEITSQRSALGHF